LTTNQSASLDFQVEVKRGSLHSAESVDELSVIRIIADPNDPRSRAFSASRTLLS